MDELKSEFLFEMSADLEEPLDIGETPRGIRRIYYVTGGTVKGPKLNGKVLPGGGDWLLIRPDGSMELDVRAAFELDDGALIYVFYRGIIRPPSATPDPSDIYFRTTPVFETASEKYAWLNNVVAVGVGTAGENVVGYKVYAIL